MYVIARHIPNWLNDIMPTIYDFITRMFAAVLVAWTAAASHNTSPIDDATINLAAFTKKAGFRQILTNLETELIKLEKIYPKKDESSRNYRTLHTTLIANSWFTEYPNFRKNSEFTEALKVVRCLYEHIVENVKCCHNRDLGHVHCILAKFWQTTKRNCKAEQNSLLANLLNSVGSSNEDLRTYDTEISLFIHATSTLRQNILKYLAREDDDAIERKKKRKKRNTTRVIKITKI
ncbi:hypothetical protein HELRODRAFT_174770 [Helobdella robusta]|uniref:Uncharacterized protein n=1 Tax=Helobdella robusta TaxID=6412 RepID=T1F8G2_HELRO|nr:hypothetical protein HELRODRAFT_174770 [Helobdella robusta]ESO01225.1 hypothetical protein HELRODRAFT_174770 [Helobdella robusta]